MTVVKTNSAEEARDALKNAKEGDVVLVTSDPRDGGWCVACGTVETEKLAAPGNSVIKITPEVASDIGLNYGRSVPAAHVIGSNAGFSNPLGRK